MYEILSGLRIVEGASFIAGPTSGLHLAQLGAEVIRFDQIGGGPDYNRRPLAGNGVSLYWESLNKGKKSVALDLASEQGRELAIAIATAPGENAGLFVTNFPIKSFLSHDRLAARRSDMITVRVMGWADGGNALDYTVNSALGIPMMTGPAELGDRPVNHVLPAWDLITGLHASLAILAAERHRRISGKGAEIRLPLGDVAMATLGHIGLIAEASVFGASRPRLGNDVFGAFGRDFPTSDGRRVMIASITPRQWKGMLSSLKIEAEVQALEAELGVDFLADEGKRFEHRDRLFPIVERATSRRPLADLAVAFDAAGVCWGPYNRLDEVIGEGKLISEANPIFANITHPSNETYLAPGAAATIAGQERGKPQAAPKLGEHTDQVLAELLGLSSNEIGRLHDQGVVGSA